MKKASDLQILTSYQELKSCRKVAEKFGMCSQSVHSRVKKMGINRKINTLTSEEKNMIITLYTEGFIKGDGRMKELAQKIGRTSPFISRFARSLGLTNSRRSCNDMLKQNISDRQKSWLQNNEHPKGMLGKTHSQEVTDKLVRGLKKSRENVTPLEKADRYSRMVETQRNNGVYNRKHGSWSASWRTIGGKTKFFRSRWEANYARYLQYLKEKNEILDWDHEPQTFWFVNILRGTRSYLPDFRVINLDGSHYWVEVKGWMDKKSKTKLKRFAKYYPEEKLVLIQLRWFKENTPELKNAIEGWELGRPC